MFEGLSGSGFITVILQLLTVDFEGLYGITG